MKTRVAENCIENTDNDSVGCGMCMSSHPNLDEFLGIAAQDSTIHGVKYVSYKKFHKVERIFWTVVVSTCFGFGVFLIHRVISKYNMSPVIISFQSEETAISQVPFPAITLCNVNLLKQSALSGLFREVDKIVDGLHKLKANKSAKVPDDKLNHMEKLVWEAASHLDHLGQFCLQAPSFLRQLNLSENNPANVNSNVKRLQDVLLAFDSNVTEKFYKKGHSAEYQKISRDIFRMARINCEDMLLKCIWADTLIDCKDIFFPIETRHGQCCVFNMMPKSLLYKISEDGHRAKRDRKNIPEETIRDWRNFAKEHLIIKDSAKLAEMNYPKHQMGGGKHYGLSVLANPGFEEYSTCTANDGWGFKIVAHSPLSSPSIMEYGAAIPPSSEAFVDMEPEVIVDSDVSNIPIDKRECYIADDPQAWLKSYNYYSGENCFSECWANHTWNECGCVQFFMPRTDNQSLCRENKRVCAEGVLANLTSNIGKQDACGQCLPACEEIQYRMQVSHFELPEDNAASYYTFNNSLGEWENATNYSIIHIYLGTGSLYAMERKKLYDLADLIANAGGLLGLTLGISIISIVEVIYLFTLRAWFRFYGNKSTVKVKQSPSISKPNGYYDWAARRKFSINSDSNVTVHAITARKDCFIF